MSVDKCGDNNFNLICQFPINEDAQIKLVNGKLQRTDVKSAGRLGWGYGYFCGTTLKDTVVEISKTCKEALDHLQLAVPSIEEKKIEKISHYIEEVERISALSKGLNNMLNVYKKRKETANESKEGISKLKEITDKVNAVLKVHQEKLLHEKNPIYQKLQKNKKNFKVNEIKDKGYQFGDITKGVIRGTSKVVSNLMQNLYECYYSQVKLISTKEIIESSESAGLQKDENLIKQVLHDAKRSQGFRVLKNEQSEVQRWDIKNDMKLQAFLEQNLPFLPTGERRGAVLLMSQGSEITVYLKLQEILKNELRNHILSGYGVDEKNTPRPIFEFKNESGQNIMTVIRTWGLRNSNGKMVKQLQSRTSFNLTDPEKIATLSYKWEA